MEENGFRGTSQVTREKNNNAIFKRYDWLIWLKYVYNLPILPQIAWIDTFHSGYTRPPARKQ